MGNGVLATDDVKGSARIVCDLDFTVDLFEIDTADHPCPCLVTITHQLFAGEQTVAGLHVSNLTFQRLMKLSVSFWRAPARTTSYPFLGPT